MQIASEMNWHEVRDPNDAELDRLAEQYQLHPLHVEDCRHRGQIAKVEENHNYLFVVLKPVDVEPDETDDEIYHYEGDHLELAPMLREQVILSNPMHPLCKDDCAGLCPHCGKNLNEGRCACPEEAPTTPFQVLRSVKTEQK